jgi:hypothetical protein
MLSLGHPQTYALSVECQQAIAAIPVWQRHKDSLVDPAGRAAGAGSRISGLVVVSRNSTFASGGVARRARQSFLPNISFPANPR